MIAAAVRVLRRAAPAWAALAALAFDPAGLGAHEIGTTRVEVRLDGGGRFEIVVVTDAAALVEKLDPDAVAGALTAAGIRARLEGADADFLRRVTVTFDGTVVRPALTWRVDRAASATAVPRAEIRLTGRTPAGARTLRWSYGWTFASYALVVHARAGGEPETVWLEGGETSAPVALRVAAPAPSRVQLLGRYVVLGFTHILPLGFDHVLFVLGIFLASRRWRAILAQVSAFTLAHSLTLGLSVYGLVSLPSAVVEPLIALSIAYVAIENVCVREMRPWRIGLVFAFGLLHGLGFAGALRDVGLPRSEFLTALVGFNLGVEAGQLSVIALASGLVGSWSGRRAWYRARIVLPASACIALAGVYWTVERLRLLG
jgi:hypothetical protein